jgi:hypothetical protein
MGGAFSVHQPIPPNTLRTKPVEVEIEPDNRIVTRTEAQFPRNASMLVGVQLCDRNGRFWPAPWSPYEWFTGDNNLVFSDAPHVLSGPPFRIVCRLYNEDNTFPRTPEIRGEVQEHAMPLLLEEFVGRLEELIRKLGK